MNHRCALACFLLFWVTAAPNLFSQEKQINTNPELTFASEEIFVTWLANVQFIQKDESTIYYHKGFRYKLMSDGKVFRTKAALGHRKRTIKWIAKSPGSAEKVTTLFIAQPGEAQLTKQGEKPVALPVRKR